MSVEGFTFTHYAADTSRLANAGLLLGQRRRRWANNKPALAIRLLFAVAPVLV